MKLVAALLLVLVLWLAPGHQGFSVRLAFQGQRASAARVMDWRFDAWQ